MHIDYSIYRGAPVDGRPDNETTPPIRQLDSCREGGQNWVSLYFIYKQHKGELLGTFKLDQWIISNPTKFCVAFC